MKNPIENFELDSIYGAEKAGEFPFKRGVYPSMYTQKPWTIRQYAGFGSAEDTNAFFKSCLASGQTGLSVAFDLATHRGYDSDHPRAYGDVGKAGVAINSLEDMQRLFDGIPLKDVSVSMTMNGAVLPILACYILTAEGQGASKAQLMGTIQNDILKEFLVRNTYIYPPQPSMRIVGDIIAYCSTHMPKFNPISISGYHMHEAGANATQELAYTLADGLEYVKLAMARGLNIDDFAPRLSFFFAIGMNFFAEVAKLRAARVLWAKMMKDLGAKDPKSMMLRTHCQTSGVSLTPQEPYNNIVRTIIEALAATLGGTQSLHTNSFDEALALPTPFSAAIARNTQLILQNEMGLCDVVDPLGGSHYVEHLTETLMTEAQKLMKEIEGHGGMIEALLKGIPQSKIEATAALRQKRFEEGQDIVVGVNAYASMEEADVNLLEIDAAAIRDLQIERLNALKKRRDEKAVQKALTALEEGAKTKANLLALTMDAMAVFATVGEVSYALEKVFTRYQGVHRLQKGLFTENGKNMDAAFLKRLDSFRATYGRNPRILIAKLGQDGHDRGAKMIAAALADYGFDVDLGPLFQTPQEVVKGAIENDVHIIGISSQAGGHAVLIPDLLKALQAQKADDIAVVVGGIIPSKDQVLLKNQGVKLFFKGGDKTLDIAHKLLDLFL